MYRKLRELMNDHAVYPMVESTCNYKEEFAKILDMRTIKPDNYHLSHKDYTNFKL